MRKFIAVTWPESQDFMSGGTHPSKDICFDAENNVWFVPEEDYYAVYPECRPKTFVLAITECDDDGSLYLSTFACRSEHEVVAAAKEYFEEESNEGHPLAGGVVIDSVSDINGLNCSDVYQNRYYRLEVTKLS